MRSLIRWFFPPEKPTGLPDFSVAELVQLLDQAMDQLPQRELGWLGTVWAHKSVDEKSQWVARRKAALLVIWCRGNGVNFTSLRRELATALQDLDR